MGRGYMSGYDQRYDVGSVASQTSRPGLTAALAVQGKEVN
jgi:hypothetical protein